MTLGIRIPRPLLWLVVAVSLWGCGEEPQPAATPKQVQTISNETFALVSSSMAYIETTARSGSGVLIESGYVLTNAEVVWPFETVDIVFPDGSEFLDVPVIGLDLQSDLAVLGPIDSPAGGLELVDGESTPKYSNVFIVGYPAKPEELGQPWVESRSLLGVGRFGSSRHYLYAHRGESLGPTAPPRANLAGGRLCRRGVT